ncbi:MAG: DNA repair protein RadC [Moraxellaceae bacterium]|jgi:DNA repair protein RadC|nr:DNA repair protein RadC [Moraxellaceae bacterium]MBP8851471.1 DNA repair protein RadC [Moraxellaceae bacterium]MBP9045223.1 DNA repair protein RadC [Moraxellaceae bacterium]MBP9730310.1 DNA repair protein RadC [Moraxellaceae bacterium]HQV41046.1 DNA repair protein RadC [Moraxellaceae bacterium]
MPITDWPEAERPREKLLAHGASSLSDAELLALFIRTGLKGRTALDLARDWISTFGSLRHFLDATPREMIALPGLGPAKLAELHAALELGRRHLETTLERQDVMSSPETTRNFLSARLRGLRHEVFAILFLDNQHRLIAFEELFRGTLDACSVHPRQVVERALHLNAAAVILSHNHPSGVAEPSGADRHITDRLRDALGLIEVRVLDHLVVGEGRPVSFAERGWL